MCKPPLSFFLYYTTLLPKYNKGSLPATVSAVTDKLPSTSFKSLYDLKIIIKVKIIISGFQIIIKISFIRSYNKYYIMGIFSSKAQSRFLRPTCDSAFHQKKGEISYEQSV